MLIKEAQEIVNKFTKEREWDVKASQRVCYLTREIGKITEYLLFTEGVMVKKHNEENVPKQLSNIFFNVLSLANILEIDLEKEFKKAIEEDSSKYPLL